MVYPLTAADNIEVGDTGASNGEQGYNLALPWYAELVCALHLARDQIKKH